MLCFILLLWLRLLRQCLQHLNQSLMTGGGLFDHCHSNLIHSVLIKLIREFQVWDLLNDIWNLLIWVVACFVINMDSVILLLLTCFLCFYAVIIITVLLSLNCSQTSWGRLYSIMLPCLNLPFIISGSIDANLLTASHVNDFIMQRRKEYCCVLLRWKLFCFTYIFHTVCQRKRQEIYLVNK